MYKILFRITAIVFLAVAILLLFGCFTPHIQRTMTLSGVKTEQPGWHLLTLYDSCGIEKIWVTARKQPALQSVYQLSYDTSKVKTTTEGKKFYKIKIKKL